MLRNTKERYGSVAITLHWLLFLMVIGMVTVGFLMGSFHDDALNAKLYFFHKSTGLVIFVLAIFRVIWALSNPKPTMPNSMTKIHKILAQTMHGLLYLILLVMPINGIFMTSFSEYPATFFGLFTVRLPVTPDKATAELLAHVHGIMAWTLIVMVTLHALAAFFHHYYYKDNILRRMLPR